MALTYAAPTVGATAVAALSAGTLVAFLLDGEMRARTFIPYSAAQSPQWNGATGTGNLAGSGTTASIVFPAVVSATQVLDSAGNATGPVKLVLQPGSGDLFNASSVMSYLVDQEVVVGTVSGTF